MNESNPPKVKLRWYQFSLRTLLIFTLFVALGFAWLGHRTQRIRNQISAKVELKKLGAEIYSHSQENLKKVLPIPDRWLWKCFSDAPVLAVRLDRTPTTDTDLEHLKGPDCLRELDLTSTQVTDAGVENLQEALPKCEIRHKPRRHGGLGE